MFQLLQPSGLFAIAGIAVPILIHLWNTRKGKTLKVGSIRFVQETATQRARSFRFTDILLLILRCLLIITLAFLIAQPVWKTQLNPYNNAGWIVMENRSMQEAYKSYQSRIDSLLNAGFKIHSFDTGFAELNLSDSLSYLSDIPSRLSYWALLRQLNEEVPQDLPVYLFTDNRLARFSGARPAVSMNIIWQIFATTDSSINQPVAARRMLDGNTSIVRRTSTPAAGFYQTTTATGASPAQGSSRSNSNQDPTISINDTTLIIDTSTLDITIYTDRYPADANYLKSALDAIQQYTRLAIRTSVVRDRNQIPQSQDWLFWLSEQNLPAVSSSNVFAYKSGKEQTINSWIRSVQSFQTGQPITLSKLMVDTFASTSIPVWTDGFGNNLLTLDSGTQQRYRFYSHFDPAWNNLPWSSSFPEMMFQIILKEPVLNNRDLRKIDVSQIQPVVNKEKKMFDKEKFVETNELTKPFWLLAFFIFCLERIISFTRKTTANA